VPVILEKAGMLERFYTDLAGNVGLGKWVVKCGPLLGFRKAASRLARRRVPDLIKAKTVSVMAGRFWHDGKTATRNGDPAVRFRQQLRQSRAFGEAAIRRGFGAATHLYSMLGECGPLLSSAKQRGLTVATEVYILLSTERILADEQRGFPEWEQAPADLELVRNGFPEQRGLLSLTDYAVCPSEVVRRDLEDSFGLATGRGVVVPYGVDASWLDLPVRPVGGRVLFVGTAGLRKGIQYLAKAAEILEGRGRGYEFRIVGEVTQRIERHSECRHLNFIGRVPHDRIQGEFARADVFVLPSLAEGSAEVTYEALAAGVPVITTEAAGSVVRHALDGWIVPGRNSAALAEAIELMVENRQLRAAISLGARARARDYTLERYGQRLVAALRTFGT
jgi:glycosyltransferase involved in cell wall biosynthesis